MGWKSISDFFAKNGFAIVVLDGETRVIARIEHEKFIEGQGWDFRIELLNGHHRILSEVGLGIRLATGEEVTQYIQDRYRELKPR